MYNIKANPFITVHRAQSLQFVGMPKQLLALSSELGLTADDAMLYCVLRSRSDYSLRNGWQDEKGRVYIIYTRDSAAKYLGISYSKATEVFHRLSAAGLIEEHEQRGKNNMLKANRIYVKKWISPSAYDYDGGLTLQGIKEGKLPYITAAAIGEYPDNSFYAIPRLLMEHEAYDELPLRAKLLYAVALDALNKSILFGTNIDSDGLPFCLLNKEDMMNILQCGERTLTSIYKKLNDIGLLERKRDGFSAVMRVYLRDFVPPEPIAEEASEKPENQPDLPTRQNLRYDSANSTVRLGKNYGTEPQNLGYEDANSTGRNRQNLRTSDTSSSQTFMSDTFSGVRLGTDLAFGSSSDAPERESAFSSLRGGVHRQLSLEFFENATLSKALTIADIAIDYMEKDLSGCAFVRVGDKTYPSAVLREEYLQVTPSILCVLVKKILERWDSIQKVPEYIHRALVTIIYDHSGESYYSGER